MTLADAAVLGIVQGLTEFLPISSSAHLILARALLGWDAESFGLAFDVACHVGTLAAVVAYFWRDLLGMAAALPRLHSRNDRSAHLLRLIIIGTIPAVIFGVAFADFLEEQVRTPAPIVATLTIGAIGLLVAERLGTRRRTEDTLTNSEAVGIGVAQAAALVPGISRSGATVTLGMLFGLQREAAARFSFLLGVPATLAAALKKGLDLVRDGIPPSTAPLFVVGVVVSAVVGYATIAYFLKYLTRHRLDVFAYYRLALAAAVAVWLIVR